MRKKWHALCKRFFFACLKLELIHRRCFRTREEARLAIFDYVEIFYSRQRRYSYLGYMSPAEFERVMEIAA